MEHSFCRRSALILIGALACARANSQATVSLATVIALMKSAADAVARFASGISDLVTSQDKTYDREAAARQRELLIDLSARSQHLLATKNSAVVTAIDVYMSLASPKQEDWDGLTRQLNDTLGSVQVLLSDVAAVRNEFVLSEAFASLTESLASRAAALNTLKGLPMPQTQTQRDSLARLNDQYRRLLGNFKLAIQQLNAYIRVS